MEKAMEEAISSPLLEGLNVRRAKGVLLNIATGEDFKVEEMNQLGELIKREFASGHNGGPNVIMGYRVEESLKNTVKITVIATGIEGRERGRMYRRIEAPEDIFRNSPYMF